MFTVGRKLMCVERIVCGVDILSTYGQTHSINFRRQLTVDMSGLGRYTSKNLDLASAGSL